MIYVVLELRCADRPHQYNAVLRQRSLLCVCVGREGGGAQGEQKGVTQRKGEKREEREQSSSGSDFYLGCDVTACS
jgi:hypothetical protein